MSGVTLSKATFENLIEHLVKVEEEENKLLKSYFTRPSKKRNEFMQLIRNYVKHIEQFIKSATKTKTTDNVVPFVIIGSEVEVKDLSDQEVYQHRVVSPVQDSLKEGDVSYLSPVGKSLLLKKVGDEVKIHAPGGIFYYQIKSIKMR